MRTSVRDALDAPVRTLQIKLAVPLLAALRPVHRFVARRFECRRAATASTSAPTAGSKVPATYVAVIVGVISTLARPS